MMRPRTTNHRLRRGVTLVEYALILPILTLLLFGLIILGLGVSRYQQVAALAREAARWASVHGKQYQRDTGKLAATPQDIYNSAIAPRLAGLKPSLLSYKVTWNTSNEPYHAAQDGSGNLYKVRNTVSVTVSYQWTPEALWSTRTLSSTSVVPMSY
jgi:Flp pilus assembly protein TadG